MRKAFWLLVAAALIIAVVVWWWPSGGFAVSIVPGWHTAILSPWFLGNLAASAVLLLVAAVILVKQLGDGRPTDR